MNQINLEKLLVQTQNSKTDAGSLKLLVAQIYQAQVQQLSDGNLRLQLPQPGGALQLNLPASVMPQIQQLLAMSGPAQTGAATTQVLLQLQPAAESQIQLTLQHNAPTVSVQLNGQALRQILLIALQHVLSPQITTADNASATLTIPAMLFKQRAGLTLQIANMQGVLLTPKEQQQLSALLSNGKSAVQLLLQLPDNTDKRSVMLGVTPQAATSAQAQLPPLQLTAVTQNTLIQQLVRLFNQQQLPAQTIATLLPNDSKLPAIVANQSVELDWPATKNTLPLLQLISPKTTLKFIASPEQFNRPVQLSQPSSASTETPSTLFPRTQTPEPAIHQAALQQAWRQLLPLLPATPSTLASLPELPEPVQQLFQLLRRSQIDGSKVLTPSQLQPQLIAALAFQPLQNAAPTTSSGTLAVAIQLLLGQLLQKPATTAQVTPQIARVISQLDQAQAGTALRQLASHSSTLQQSQLATLDTSNNQQLILQLPLQQGQQSQFCQLMLEQREADGKQPNEKRNLWQLTMRFDLQQYGSMLVVAKLTEQQLKLQFYTEQLAAKQQAERFLPILKDRCIMQGIKVEHAECVLGKIPDTLVPRANSLLAIKA
ncbi:flagellar hook-length control protein FliK [Rheinheimera gaetbuli]